MIQRSLILTLILALASIYTTFADEYTVSSPDGSVVVTIADTNGSPQYSVSYNNNVYLCASPLGVVTDLGDFSQAMTITAATPSTEVIHDYEIATIKRSHVHTTANQSAITFSRGDRKIYDILFEVGNNDIAFRYHLYPQGDTICCVVREEVTGFHLPDSTTAYLCPQAKPMEGWRRTSPSYETPYTIAPVGGNGYGFGYTFPCLFRTTQGWLLLSETGVTSAYCGGRLIGQPSGLYTIAFPQPEEMNGNGTVEPGIALPGDTPWRTITLGETLAPIVETTIPYDVVMPLYEPSRDYIYGAGAWSWILGQDPSVNYDDQKRYIDFAAAMGWQTVLVDNYWDTQIGRQGIEDLAHYAATKGIALFLWYNTNGYWNDSPQTPRDIMNNSITRHKEMRWLQGLGVRGIKVDFMGSDKQKAFQLFEDILNDANDYGLEVIFHGCTLPRGWERMYPNFIANEAVLASENLYFGQEYCDNEAFNATLHPFIRNTVASMDFGGSALNKVYNKDNDPNQRGNIRRTSDVFALATAVLFQSCNQHFALAPNNLDDAPAWAIDFMKSVPTTWDDTRYLAGEPGQFVILARRHNNDWYIAGVNAQQEPVNIDLTLPMLSPHQAVTIYADDSNLCGSVTQQTIPTSQTLAVTIPTNAAILITTQQ